MPKSNTQLTWLCQPLAKYSARQLLCICRLRQDVFILEQTCLYPDIDDLDADAQHVSLWQDTTLIGCARIIAPGILNEHCAIGRYALARTFRGNQLGRELMRYCIQQAQQLYPNSGIQISAQNRLRGFYESLGFVVKSDVYLEDGIEHIKMHLASN